MKDGDCLERYGCTYAQYKTLQEMTKAAQRDGCTRPRTPIGAFAAQRCSARQRGVGWGLKLWEWWEIWQQSGKWENRGLGKGKYVMCRRGDDGPYETGNVYIATQQHNSANQLKNPYRAGHPDYAETRAKRIRATQRVSRKTKYHDLPLGVTLVKGRFRAQICLGGKLCRFGPFETVELAHQAYLTALDEFERDAAA